MGFMSVRTMAEILGCSCSLDDPILGFEVDSRNVRPGYVFFALKGESVDGHDFVEQAFVQGALCAVVSKNSLFFQKYPQDPRFYYVEDRLKSLHQLAAWKMKQKKRTCIGITGSVGKTTTKEFLATLLEGAFPGKVQKTPGNANSQVGLPLSILNEELDGDIFVVEMGMSRAGEISSLVAIAPPDIAVVTQVALAHALYFPQGLEDIARAKAEILSHPNTKRAFAHRQTQQFQAFQEKDRGLSFYGLGIQGQDHIDEAVLWQQGGQGIIQDEKGQKSPLISLPFTASHLQENFLVAALVARELGVEWNLIAQQAKLLAPYKMRFETVMRNGVVYINDAYNANPASVKAALHNLPLPQKGGRVIAALGEMRELGSFSEHSHREIGREAAGCVDLLFCLGKECEFMAEEFTAKSGKVSHRFSDLYALKNALKNEVKIGDVVLIKASKSLKMWGLLEESD